MASPYASPQFAAYHDAVVSRTGLAPCEGPECFGRCPFQHDNVCDRLVALAEVATDEEKALLTRE